MKTIILESILPLLYKSQEEVNKLLEEDYKVKEVKNIKYLMKDNE